MYAKIENDAVTAYPYGPSEVMRDNPNTSFPIPMTEADLAPYGVVPVVPRNPPQFDQITQNCNRVDPLKEDGQWVEAWVVTDATAEEIAQRTDQKAGEVRTQRNSLLAASDWTMLPDAPTDHQAWADYRQQLRDVTNQPGFPLNVIWPEPPAT